MRKWMHKGCNRWFNLKDWIRVLSFIEVINYRSSRRQFFMSVWRVFESITEVNTINISRNSSKCEQPFRTSIIATAKQACRAIKYQKKKKNLTTDSTKREKLWSKGKERFMSQELWTEFIFRHRNVRGPNYRHVDLASLIEWKYFILELMRSLPIVISKMTVTPANVRSMNPNDQDFMPHSTLEIKGCTIPQPLGVATRYQNVICSMLILLIEKNAINHSRMLVD